MTGKEHIDIFSSTTCLSENDLRGYAENSLSEQDKLRVEKHLVDCELCSDALEGYSLMNNPAEFGLRTASIDQKIDTKTSSSSVFLNREKLSYVAAAAVVLIFCSIVFVLIEDVSKESNEFVSDEIKGEDYKREVRKNNLVETPALEDGKDGKKDRNQDVAAQTAVSGKLGGVLKETNEGEDGQFVYDVAVSGAAPADVSSDVSSEAEAKDEAEAKNEPEAPAPDIIVAGNANQAASGGSTRETLSWGDADDFESVVTDEPLNDMASSDKGRKDSGVKAKDKDLEIAAGFYREAKADLAKVQEKSESKKAKESLTRTESVKLGEESQSQVVTTKSVRLTTDYSIVSSELSNEATVSEADEALEDEEFAPAQGVGEPAPTPSYKSGAEERPRYVGGNEQMTQYLLDNIQYPDSAKAQRIEGTVIVQFQVEADSSITNVRSLNDIGGGLDKEAVRVVESMPDWIPARKRGKAVTEEYNLPVKFKLEK